MESERRFAASSAFVLSTGKRLDTTEVATLDRRHFNVMVLAMVAFQLLP